VTFLLLTGLPARADMPELINGQPHTLDGSVGVTFWTAKRPGFLVIGGQKYKLLDPGREQTLLEGARIEAPPGFEVKQESLGVRLEATSYSYRVNRTETTVRYQQYLIRGRWTVRPPQDCAEGEHEIRIVLPAVARVRDAIKAGSPDWETAIVFRVKTYRTAENRSAARWQGNYWKGLGCLLGLSVALLVLGFSVWSLCADGWFQGIFMGIMAALSSWGFGLGFFGFTGRALLDLWRLRPGYAIAAAAGANVAYFILLWLVSNFGRWWNRIWALILGIGIGLFGLVALAVFAVPAKLPYVAEGRQLVPVALTAVVPALLLACLAALLRSAAPARAEETVEPHDEVALAQVREHLRQLTTRRTW
jgi:hypothetical protein